MKLEDFIKLIDVETLNIYLNGGFVFRCYSDSSVLNFYKENEIENIEIDFSSHLIKIFLKK
jgi:hypothetical protein